MDFVALTNSIKTIHKEFSSYANRAVNAGLTLRNWLIGCYIAEYELQGEDRATYGEALLSKLAVSHAKAQVSSCGKRQLYNYLRFYQTYPQLDEMRANSTVSLPKSVITDRTISGTDPQMIQGDNSPIGLLLCTGKNHALVEYALAGMDNQLFVSKYQLELSNKDTMREFIESKVRDVGRLVIRSG